MIGGTRSRGRPHPGPLPWWELCGRIPFLLQLGLGGLGLAVIQAAGPFRQGYPAGVAAPGIALALAQALAGLAAWRGRFLLAGTYMAAALASGLLSSGSAVEREARSAGLALYGAGILWIVLRRAWIGGPGSRTLRAASVLLAGMFLAFLPATARDLGRGIGGALAPSLVSPASPGERLPDVRFRRLDGTWIEAPGRGTVQVLTFWATWCAPCRRELPEVAGLAEELAHDPEVRFLAVCVEERDPRAVAGFLGEIGAAGLPAAVDPERERDRLGIRSLPTTLLARDGRVLARYEGYHRDLVDRLRAEVRLALREGNGASGS